MSRTLAMIPAAGRGSRMQYLTENSPKSMIPVSGKPLISYLLDQLIENNITDVCIIVGYKKDVMIDYINLFYADKLNIIYVEQKELLGLGHAIYVALNQIDLSVYDSLFIMLGDAIFKNNEIYKFGSSSYIACKKVTDYSRWCIADTDGAKVTGFFDKPSFEPNYKLAVVGAYYFTDISKFAECAEQVISNQITIKNEYQISSIMLNYIEQVEDISILTVNNDEWFDFGELDTYNKNKKLFNQCRYFNSLKYLSNGIDKSSNSNPHKIQKEIMWFLTMPQSLRKYIANMVDYSLDDSNVHYTTEYCNGLSLQEMWLYNNLSSENWLKIAETIVNTINEFHNESNPMNISLSKFLKNSLSTRCSNDFFNETTEYIINNKKMRSIHELSTYLFDKLNKLDSSDCSKIIHGDMVFSNIIYDFANDTLSLIDPRGNFNDNIIYGDFRYDLAKLAQCIYGDYDYIVNDLFTLNVNNNNINYSLYNDKMVTQKMQLTKYIVDSFNMNMSDIMFITAIQFATMIPLHAENKNHQKMMKIKFIELLNLAHELEIQENA